jgi:hypothetical protein
MARRLASALACAVALASPAAALFSTTLHGAPTEQIEPGTPGAATLELQPWLTTIDPEVRALRRQRHCASAMRALPHPKRAPAGLAVAACGRSGALARRGAVRAVRVCAAAVRGAAARAGPRTGQRTLGVRKGTGCTTATPPLLPCAARAQAVCNDGTSAGYYYVKGAALRCTHAGLARAACTCADAARKAAKP